MKNIVKLLAIGAAALSLSGCEEFLSADPVNKFASETFFESGETDLMLYTNGLLDSYAPDAEDIAMGDSYTDLTASQRSTEYYVPGTDWDATKQSGWAVSNWRNIRRANIMIQDMVRAQDKTDEAVYNHYAGVARFWRAYFYYSKVKTFGDVPWMDAPLDIDSDKLYAGRDDREFVMSKVLEDLTFAGENCSPDSQKYYNVINKWVVLTFKSRVCLFEGTYRKYHAVNPSTKQLWNNQYGTADDFLREAAKAAKEVIDNSGIKLHKNYRELFVTSDLKNIGEVIWHRQYQTVDGFNVWHDLTLNFNTPTSSQRVSPTKNLMNMYLNADGTPITTDKVSINDEFTGRDPRLSVTVQCPGWTKYTGSETVLKPLNFVHTMTGYTFTKWSQEVDEGYTTGRADNSVPIFRYAEVLLNYAEAQAELNGGNLTAEEWALTIGALRDRAGVTSLQPGTAGYVEDTWLKDYYARAEDAAVTNLSNTILEIRRERATEMILENLRVDDLYRWHCANLIADRSDKNEKGWRGIYVSASDAANGFKYNDVEYTFSREKDQNPTNYKYGDSKADHNWTLSEGDSGYLIYHKELLWQERMYIRPIPTTANTKNPELGQNFGW